ncbi:MAG: tetratricopeptide repeat protein, partial [Bdellovibrionales bacterium]|nr:tetratricopeptide repeat protein [Bdellovibrionales bacterium]
MFLSFILWPSGPNEEMGDQIHLTAPQGGASAKIPKEELEKKIQKAYSHYLRDTYQNYLSGQNELVGILEAEKKFAPAIGQLCMTYLELWPFAFQDSQDLRTVTLMVQLSGEADPAGIYSATCRTLDLIIRGRTEEARNIVETVLEVEASQGRTPVDFYYLKAYLLGQTKDYQTAIGYLRSAEKLEPRRIRFFALEGQLLMESGDDTNAAKVLKRVIGANGDHSVAKVLLGIIEERKFRHFDKAKTLLLDGLESENKVPRKLASQGYFSLAEMELQNNNTSKALNYARKAYLANSVNLAAKNLILKLGGKDELKSTPLKSIQLILEGDQFVREGDCQSAQAHYKAAYELEKNAVAAMKAGQCLWKLNFSAEALEWLQKAIQSDPKLVEAYVLLADYYTQRYNFVAASRTLSLAQKSAPKSYEVYRGFALVELRRNSPQSAITYGKTALSPYETDVETHIIMARAYMAQEDYRTAYAHAAKAVEIDANYRDAQIVYAETLAGIQGFDSGLSHLVKLVQTYPMVTEYRLALGKLYAKDEQYSEAENTLRQVISLEEKPKEAYLELGKVLRKINRHDEALKVLLQAAVLDPADAEPLFQAGITYMEVKKPNEAIIQFQRVLKINPRYPLVHYWIGKAALEADNYGEALKQSQEERQVNPNLAEAYLLAAEAYTEMKQYSLCAQEFQKAIKLRPQGANIYVSLARCYRLAENLDIAEAMLNQAAAQESGYAPIYREQGEVFERKGEYQRAMEAYRQYFILNPNAPDREAIESR